MSTRFDAPQRHLCDLDERIKEFYWLHTLTKVFGCVCFIHDLLYNSGGSSEEATEAVPAQIKLNKKKIKNIIFN
jgi:hypothetical protein